MKKVSRFLALVMTCVLALSVMSGFTASASQNVTVSIFINQSWIGENMTAMGEAFEEANPGITLDWQAIPDNDFTKILNTNIQTGETTDIVFENGNILARYFTLADYFVDLTGSEWDTPDLSMRDGMLGKDGLLYGYPNADGLPNEGIIYNKRIFAELGLSVPTNLDEFMDCCEKIKASGQLPVVQAGKDLWTIGMWLVHMCMNTIETDADPDLLDKLNAMEVHWTDVPGILKDLETILAMHEKGYFNEDMFATTDEMAKQMFAEGEAAMCMQGDWFATFVAQNYPDFPLDEIGIFPVPNVPNAKLTSGMASGPMVFKASPRAEEAVKFVNFYSSQDNRNLVNPLLEYPWNIEANALYGKTPELAAVLATGVGRFTEATAAMLAGDFTPEQALQQWDDMFIQLATEAAQK